MRIVIDTSTLISAVLWNGLPHRLMSWPRPDTSRFARRPRRYRNSKRYWRDRNSPAKFANAPPRLTRSSKACFAWWLLYPAVALAGLVKADADDDEFLACALVAQSGVFDQQ